MKFIDSAKAWFTALPADKRRNVVVGALCAAGAIGMYMVASGGDQKPVSRQNDRQKLETSLLTGKTTAATGIEQLSATARRQQETIEQLQRQVQLLSATSGQPGNTTTGSTPQQQPSTALPFPGDAQQPTRTQNPTAATDAQMAAGGINRPPARDLPPPNIPGVTPGAKNSDVYDSQDEEQPAEPPPPPKLRLRMLQPRETPLSDASGSRPGMTPASARAKEPEYYLPLGSIISGTLMTGVDAPASGTAAKKDPFPALFRIKHEAVLPNAGLLDLRECFMIASSFADLSSERVYMRAEGISCQRSDGSLIEANVDAFASGSDGRAGIRGIVVEKTGAIIARSLLAGFVAGIGKAAQPQRATPITVNPQPGSQQDYQYPSGSYLLGSGIMGGGSAAAERIAQIYEDMARQMVPVVSINAGIPVDFIMTRGATLRFRKVGDLTSARAAPNSAGTGVTTSVTGSTGGGSPIAATPGQSSFTPPPIPGMRK